MIKKVIKYTDFNGQNRSEVAYFNLNKLEVLKLTAKLGMDIDKYAKQLAESEDLAKMLQFIEDIILMAYGEKSQDGRSFVKSKDRTAEFESSNAFAELFDQLVTNPQQTAQFASGIVGAKPSSAQSKPHAVQPKKAH